LKNASFIVIFVIAEYLLKNSELITSVIVMSIKPKKLALMLTLGAILLSLTLTNIKIVGSNSTGGAIDLYTQKEPYNGKGLSMPSDAFGPQETVVLYALVTYNELPLQDLLVAFYVQVPSNTSFCRSAMTNSSGIATINFTIPTPSANVNESEVFGEWHTLANVIIDSKYFQDSLAFRVDWIVKLISVRTIDQDLSYRTNFGIGGDVGIEITLRSIAMVVKSATIAVVVHDELGVPVNYSAINDFQVQPNEKLVYIYCKLSIPKWAFVGKATIFVSALTTRSNASAVPYCPAVSTEFYILLIKPLTITFNDVAVVEVTTSAESVEVGQTVDISAVVQNEGTENESFTVSAYYDGTLIETLPMALSPYSHAVLIFAFNTTTVALGNYTITMSIPYLINEADLTDNTFIDGVVQVKAKPSPLQQYYLTVRTDPLFITYISSEGWYYEGTNVNLTAPEYVSVSTGVPYSFSYWDVDGTSQGTGNTITVLMDNNHTATAHYIQVVMYVLTIITTSGGVTDPLPGAYDYPAGSSVQVTANPNKNYIFNHWELNNVSVGSTNPYTVLMDRNQTLKAVFSLAPTGFFIPEWFFWPFLPLLILLVLLLLILFFYSRRRREKAEEAFYSGWTAWYYCYDLRSKIRKI
jgi:hypothetical protein